MSIEMKVSGIMLDPLTNMPIVILKSDDGQRLLPIWIGPFEAQAIAMRRDGVSSPRPMTHDLVGVLVSELGAHLDRVVITDLRDNTFYALLVFTTPAGPREIDSRPSDAIAVALRAEAPIFVEPRVLERAAAIDADEGEDPEQRLRKWFEELDPSDLSKYPM